MHGQDGSVNANMASDMISFGLGRKTEHDRNRLMIATLQAQTVHYKALHGITR